MAVLIALAATPQARADTIPETNDGEKVVEIAAGGYHSCARVETGRVFCWGGNGNGQLGDGTTTDRTATVRVVDRRAGSCPLRRL